MWCEKCDMESFPVCHRCHAGEVDDLKIRIKHLEKVNTSLAAQLMSMREEKHFDGIFKK